MLVKKALLWSFDNGWFLMQTMAVEEGIWFGFLMIGGVSRNPWLLREGLVWFPDNWRCVPESLAVEGGFGLVS